MTTADPARGEGQPPRRVTSESILHLLEERIGAAARIALHESDTATPSPTAPSPTAQSAEPLSSTNVTARYQVMDLLGQGGVGAVHRGRDADLGREVAMKFLHEQYRDRADVLQRFVEEAQIGGQLQHPGIVPVYELGMVDGQPFFAMKMVKGTTLASRLDERESPQSQRGSFLAIFEQVCQTIAYAHARGVVHRDLKPANVMIGSFGEVQVVDWGMGKVLPRDGEARLAAQPASREKQAHASVIRTVRSDGHGTQSLVGSVMGTPAYMPREQAIGDVEAMDRRSDVFALGAILCEILTGKPPYVGDAQEVLVMATLARLEKAHQRLAACGADPELIGLATRCLQMDPAARPESASVVAAAVHGHLAATEARAHEATLRALTLKRTQKYGIALTAVIALGLCASLWFWRDADAQRVAAQEAAHAANVAKIEEQKAREQAEANLANFNRLSQVVRLEAAKASAQDLFPAWPEHLDALRQWQEARARPLREALVGLKDTLRALEQRARDSAASVAETDRAQQVDERTRRRQRATEELAQKTAQLDCWRAAATVRSGNGKVAAVDLSGTQLPTTAEELNALAWPLIDPARTSFGREAEGLELARRAVAAAGDGPLRPVVLDTLAWACVAVGLDRDAIQHSEAALAAAPAAQGENYAVFLKRIREQVRRFSVRDFARVMTQHELEIAALQRELEGGTTWAFDDDADTFLHGTLGRLIESVETFENEEVVDVARRLHWAERIHEASITRHADRWREAHDAIAKADGETASRLYAATPIDLQPQLGLVPLGRNQETGLWEFYHLRSAFDPARHGDATAIEIPAYDGTSRIDMNGRGIVFVLLPGGTFHMGAQNQDPAAPNFDPGAEPDEMPVTAITLAPFFLAKHELTQGQWARLSNGSWPSWYLVGNSYGGIPGEIMDSHPVEQVDWAMCSGLMRQHALQLPTEAQWEYGCRAGTTWPWSSGPARESLELYANVLDHTASTVEPIWEGGDAWDDHYKGPAPVGTFRPNPFGLYDMHGNQWEWCQDWFGRYEEPPRAGDGLREPMFREDIRASRGGGHQTTSLLARSAYRAYRNPKTQIQNLGLRPARRLLP